MRRAYRIIAALFLVLVSAAPVSAAPPTMESTGPIVEEYPAGVTCDFAVRLESIVSKAKTITFDRRDGSFAQNTSGTIVERVTNLDTGASVVRNSSGPGKLGLNSAGHVVIRFGGASVLTFFDGDVTGRGVLYLKGGGAVFEIGDDGFFYVGAEMPAHVEDLCTTLG
jgi:hypothetical protein